MSRDEIENVLAFLDAAPSRKLPAENDLFAGVVRLRPEDEVAAPGDVDAPAGERSRDLDHVFLRVTTVDAERVQLHQLARVVLIEAAPRTCIEERAGTRPSGRSHLRQRRVSAVGLALRVV